MRGTEGQNSLSKVALTKAISWQDRVKHGRPKHVAYGKAPNANKTFNYSEMQKLGRAVQPKAKL